MFKMYVVDNDDIYLRHSRKTYRLSDYNTNVASMQAWNVFKLWITSGMLRRSEKSRGSVLIITYR